MEEYEEVPWSELVAAARPTVPRSVMFAAVGVAALVVGVVALRTLSPASAQVVGPAPPATTDMHPSTTTMPLTTPAPVVIPAAPLSEADLRAFPSDMAARAAAVRAEWFVTDFFTVDHDPTLESEVRASLPHVEATLAQEGSSPGISYVEWARATHAEPVGDRWTVTVVYRTIGKTPDGPYQRNPVRAVRVPIHVDAAGATIPTDFPTPVAVPTAEVPPLGVGPDEVAPDHVVNAASGLVVGYPNPRLAASSRVEGGWRLVFVVVDEVGIGYPVTVRVGDSGAPLP